MIGWIFGGGWKWLLGIGIAGAISYMAYDVYTDYRDMQAQLLIAAEERATLRAANEANEATIRELESEAMRIGALRDDLERSLAGAEVQISRLQELLSKHDLTYLAKNKPGLIERRINDATDRAFSDIECLTGGVCD